MFRKSDKKKWLAKLERFFGEEMVAQLLDLSQDVEVHSIANSRNSIFTQNKEPIFFEVCFFVCSINRRNMFFINNYFLLFIINTFFFLKKKD